MHAYIRFSNAAIEERATDLSPPLDIITREKPRASTAAAVVPFEFSFLSPARADY